MLAPAATSAQARSRCGTRWSRSKSIQPHNRAGALTAETATSWVKVLNRPTGRGSISSSPSSESSPPADSEEFAETPVSGSIGSAVNFSAQSRTADRGRRRAVRSGVIAAGRITQIEQFSGPGGRRVRHTAGQNESDQSDHRAAAHLARRLPLWGHCRRPRDGIGVCISSRESPAHEHGLMRGTDRISARARYQSRRKAGIRRTQSLIAPRRRSRRSSGGSAKTRDSSVSRSSRAGGKPRSTRKSSTP